MEHSKLFNVDIFCGYCSSLDAVIFSNCPDFLKMKISPLKLFFCHLKQNVHAHKTFLKTLENHIAVKVAIGHLGRGLYSQKVIVCSCHYKVTNNEYFKATYVCWTHDIYWSVISWGKKSLVSSILASSLFRMQNSFSDVNM